MSAPVRAVRQRLVVAVALAVSLAGCGPTPQRGAEAPPEAAPPSTVPADPLAGGEPSGWGAPFDPAAHAVGDTVSGLRLAASDFRRAYGDSVWVGRAAFEGTAVLRGVYATHPECADPEGDPSAPENAGCETPCLHEVTREGGRLPRVATDDRRPWACFSNPEAAVAVFGAPRPWQTGDPDGRPVCVTADRYEYVVGYSDVVNEARFVSGEPEPCGHGSPGPPPPRPR